MLTRSSRLFACGSTLAFASCISGPLDVEGARCPCPEGYACVADRCTRDAGAGGGSPISECVRHGQLAVAIAYVTPNMAAVTWQTYGTSGFDHFEILIGEGSEAFPPEDPSRYRRITPAERPELGFTEVVAGEANVILVDGLDPGTTYWVSGAIFGAAGCSLTSATTFQTPPVPANEATIFADDILGDMAYAVPANFQRTNGELRFDASCAANPTLPGCTTCCYENVIIGFPSGVPLATTVGASQSITVPYFEADVSFEPPAGAQPLVQAQRFYAVVTNAGGDGYRIQLPFQFTLPTGSVAKRIQIPFSALDKFVDPDQNVGRFTAADAMTDGAVTSFVIGGDWREGTVMRMDNVKIRY